MARPFRNGSLLICALALILVTTPASRTLRAQQYSSDLAVHLVETAGIDRGLCTVIGWRDDDLLQNLTEASELFVHGWNADAAKVASARKAVDAAGLYGSRCVLESGSAEQLPYAENTIDLLLATDLTPDKLQQLKPAEVLRALRPLGKAILGQAKAGGGDLSADQLKSWIKKADVADAKVVSDEFGTWAILTKPPQEGVDDWTHWEHSPDNNPVSKDNVIKAPYMTKWLGLPYYISMPAITTAAGGRMFNAIGHIAHHKREEEWLNTLIARNGYNGTILWTRKLPAGYLVHRSAFIATDDVFYMIDTDGSGVLMLNPETGDEIGRIDVAGARGQWKWMALQDGMLYALVGDKGGETETMIVRSQRTHWSWGELSKGYYKKRVPWGFGKTLVAYDLDAKKRRWIHKEKTPIDSRGMVMGGEKIFLYAPDSRIVGLDAKTGREIWENKDPEVRKMIAQEGRGLSSTPGFRSMTMCVHTPDALIFQGQTRMNVVAISTSDGYPLWNKRKTTNNPNALFLDDSVILGVGKNGTTQMIDPATGDVRGELGFTKRSCARLTGTSDSLFCRGWPDGLTRYDRERKKVMFNGAFRPGCNDGVVAANGLLYTGPWPCDCNLMVLGRIALASAGDFKFEQTATNEQRLEKTGQTLNPDTAVSVQPADWAGYRGGNSRGSATEVGTPAGVGKIWDFQPATPGYRPTPVTAAGGLIYQAGDDGKIRAIDAVSGNLKWAFLTGGPIMQPPTIADGRAYFGSGDGYVYALDAASGDLLWRFRAAPAQRRVPIYGNLSSIWPVHTGVLVQDGIAYAAAGMIDYDGTYVFALDAKTGEIIWQNHSSGHLDPDLRKGVSAHGDLTIAEGRLWMPGGNVVSPAAYHLKTGEYLGNSPGDGSPQGNRGEEIGIFRDKHLILGGRLRFSPIENVVNPGQFAGFAIQPQRGVGNAQRLHQGKIPPTWNDDAMAMVDGRLAVPACYDADAIEKYLQGGKKPKPRWVAESLAGSDTIALTLTPNAVLAICEMPKARSRHSRWIICALDVNNGHMLWERTLPGDARPGGLAVDRDGRILVSLTDGGIVCYGDQKVVLEHVSTLVAQARQNPADKPQLVAALKRTLKSTQSDEVYDLVLQNLEQLGAPIDEQTNRNGGLSRWSLIAPVPWNEKHPIDAVMVGEPNVDVHHKQTVAGRALEWRNFVTDDENGMVDLATLYGPMAGVAAYAYAEFNLPQDRELVLQVGSNDGFKCWFNGQEAGRFDTDGGRGYAPDQNALPVKARKGVNRVLIKVTQLGARWAFGVRLTDRDGKPISVEHPPK